MNETLLAFLRRHRFREETFCHFWQQGEGETPISFRGLFREAARYRRRYTDAGLNRGDTVIIATDFSPDGIYAFVGALVGGFVPAFLAPFTERQHRDQFAATVSGVVDYTRPGAIVASPGFAADLVPRDLPLIVTNGHPGVLPEDDAAWVDPALDDVAFMQFSSGTTGLRKGVMLHHRAVVAQIRAFRDVVPLGPGDLIASWLPLYHDMGLIACFIIPLALGVPIALQDPIEWARAPSRLFAAIERHRASHVWLPNFAYNHLRLTVAKDARYDLSSLKAVIDCSEPCKASTFDGFAAQFAGFGVRPEMLATSYAMAEAVFAVTQSPIGRAVARTRFDRDALRRDRMIPDPDGIELLSTGRVLPGIELAVFGPKGAVLADGQIGEIGLRGEFVFKGYHNNAGDTAASFRDGWFLTGDLGAVIDGEVFVTGRLKDVIIVNGKNFYAHDIEECVSRVAAVKPGRAAAFAIDNEIAGSEEVVVVAETELPPDTYRELGRTIKQTVVDALDLTAVRAYPVPLGWLIKTTSGKMSRKENQEKYLGELAERRSQPRAVS